MLCGLVISVLFAVPFNAAFGKIEIEVVDFVNRNSIAKNDIQQIVANDYHIILFYWEEEKETITVSDYTTSKHFYMSNEKDECDCNYK